MRSLCAATAMCAAFGAASATAAHAFPPAASDAAVHPVGPGVRC
jgi:hypothetical protein